MAGKLNSFGAVARPEPLPLSAQEDPVTKLKQLKEMPDASLISQDGYDKTEHIALDMFRRV